MKEFTKDDLEKAYAAGKRSVEANNILQQLFEDGCKDAPAERTFQNWYEINYLEKPKKSYSGWQEPNGNIG